MLGSLSDAEDVVQDAWLRWERAEAAIDFPATYLTRIVTRLCLDRRKSARARRETYIGPWLPDPILGSFEPGETTADDITITLMLAMERLSPLERAAFLLHDVFDMPMTEVATTLDRDPAAVRQLASRARKHMRAARPRFAVEATEADRIARAFFVAARDGDTAQLAGLLAEDVEIHADGGGKVLAFRNVVRGIEPALRLFAGLRRKHAAVPTLVRTVMILRLPQFAAAGQGRAWIERARFLSHPAEDRPVPAGTISAWQGLLDYARTHPRDPRSPEALYWLVRISRWGHVDDRGGYKAFRLLHTRYPGSSWTRRSPYYYD